MSSLVVLTLTDRPSIDQPSYHNLKYKFDSQQFGKLLWFVRREKYYTHIPIEFAKDKLFIESNLRDCPDTYKKIYPPLKEDIDIVADYFLITMKSRNQAPSEVLKLMMEDMDFVVQLLEKHADHLCEEDLDQLINYFPSVSLIFTNKQYFYSVVKFNVFYTKNVLVWLSMASDELKNDRQILLECVKQNGFSLRYTTSEELRNDREIILHAVKNDGLILKELDKRWASDREILKCAIEQNGNVIAIAPPGLDQDREIISIALKSNSMALEYLSIELRSNKEIVLEAVRNDKPLAFSQSSLMFASSDLRHDKEVLLNALKKNPFGVKSALFMDEELLKVALRQRVSILKILPDKYSTIRDRVLSDREFVIEITSRPIEERFSILKYLPSEMVHDREIALQLVKHNVYNFKKLPHEFQSDKELYLEMIKHDYMNAKYCPFMDDENFQLEAIRVNGFVIHHIHQFHLSQPLMLEAMKQNGKALSEVWKFRQNYPVLVEAVKSNGYYLDFSEELYQARLDHCYYGAKV